MDHFQYQSGVLTAEGVPIPEIAKAVGTPFYCYSSATLERHYRVFKEAFEPLDTLVCFAVKANSNLAVLRTLAALGSGADVVSEGELRRALAAGIPPERIVFSGVGKTPAEMLFALSAGIYQFNVESEPELRVLDGLARDYGHRAPVSLRINPDVDAGTNEKISTGRAEDKFGIPWADALRLYDLAGELSHIDVIGADVHIGSQITALEPFEAAFERIIELVLRLRDRGHAIDRLDLGGGLGVPYFDEGRPPPHPRDYAAMIKSVLGTTDLQLLFEPGRLIAGNAGILVSEVIYRKEGEGRSFLVIDAAMNDLMRPALYNAFHHIVPVEEAPSDAAVSPVDVVGPICETGDTFARNRPLPALGPGDLVAFKTAGAYGAVMASTYNSRLLVPEVMVRDGQFAIVRERPSFEAMLGLDKFPDWLKT
ncbi:MAG: diaminopimelate decarboxylase [Pseudomonadota bacterium]